MLYLFSSSQPRNTQDNFCLIKLASDGINVVVFAFLKLLSLKRQLGMCTAMANMRRMNWLPVI